MTPSMLPFDEGLPWEEEFQDAPDLPVFSDPFYGGYEDPTEISIGITALSRLLDQMVMDIQHLEVELVRTRYRLSFHLPPPHGEYLRMEIFSGMGGRYQGNPAFDEYLRYRGFREDEDAVDTPFHVARMLRLANGYDDYPDLYP